MHELSIAENICEVARSHLSGGQRLKTVHLRLGLFSGVVESSLEFCFSLTAARHGLEGAVLCVETPAAAGTCSACGETTEMESMWTVCKKCGYAPLSVEGARDLRITRIEVEEVDDV
jgi:hydrogenase nickel incorporation protein HypA/HybF